MIKNTSKMVILTLVCLALTGCMKSGNASILDRVAVTGASVTSGYGLKTPPIKGDLSAYPINMKHIMEGMITEPHDEVVLFSDMMFFLNPHKYGQSFISNIKAHDPTLVVGIDFLFWFGHGTPPSGVDVATYRMEKLNYALSLLDQLQCKIIIGNLPNVQTAIGTLLTDKQVPTTELLASLNNRIETWGKDRSNVMVIDAYHLWNLAMSGEEIRLMGAVWPKGSQSKLLQQDMLHTKLDGTIAASLLVAEALDGKGLETNPNVIMKNAAHAARQEH